MSHANWIVHRRVLCSPNKHDWTLSEWIRRPLSALTKKVSNEKNSFSLDQETADEDASKQHQETLKNIKNNLFKESVALDFRDGK